MAGTMIVDGKPVELNGEKNILEVARKAGVELPTFCYHSELSVYGACRMCLVELGNGQIVAGCSTPPRPGLEVKTTTPRVQKIRKMALELMLANHDRDCTTCEKNGNCKLQDLAHRFGIRQVRFGQRDIKVDIDDSSPALVRDPNKCILCGDCVRVCQEIQGIGVLDFAHRGSEMTVTPAFGKEMAEVDCVNCGQCAAVCPTGALVVKSQVEEVWQALHDPQKTVIVQIAPAVRVAVGETFGLEPGENTLGKLTAALRQMGFDKIFDTSFAADLTVMEEGTEFLTRLKNGENLPQFTSCCPAWVKYTEQYCPEMLDHLSTCRSPQQMFGSLAKKYYAKELNIKPGDMVVVSIMPCTAKKFEAQRPEFVTEGAQDVDFVLTTQEVVQMIRESGLDYPNLESDSLDMPFGFTSGGGIIFGVTGGVSEAVLRAAHYLLLGEELDQVNFTEVRGTEGLREAEIDVGGTKVRLAIVYGLAQAKHLLEELKAGRADYHLVEVMACPSGCVGGAGQPVGTNAEIRSARAQGIYTADKAQQLRKSYQNPLIEAVYEKWLGEPNGEAAHTALHTTYSERRRIQGDSISLGEDGEAKQVEVAVCVGTCCYLKGSYDVLQDLGRRLRGAHLEEDVDLKATFCFENCGSGINVKVGDTLYSGISPAKTGFIFDKITEALQSK
ncbi:MAG: 2Fe-2S iron-sulfur cluster binding domain-containing protein [Firmicutes bacterium]|nr:2Fe-2S iron-sulfur cluster binding domain-containing protein [Bacillota bacterium]